jgi:hypothetical protein
MTGLIEDNGKIHELAIQSLQNMLARFGPDYRFPPDAIWEFLPSGCEVLSSKKSHHPKQLVNEGYLQHTGAMTKAQSGKRAGNKVQEYRFGHLLVPANSLHIAHPTPTYTLSPHSSSISFSKSIQGLQQGMESEGYILSAAEIANFILAMTVSPLVILSGISGTGKSLLPRKFAKFTKSSFQQIPVQPQWADNSDLLAMYLPSLGKLCKTAEFRSADWLTTGIAASARFCS